MKPWVQATEFRCASRIRQQASNSASNDVKYNATNDSELFMRTTLSIDDKLFSEAQRLTGVSQKPALIREALHALIERESARRLARLGGSEPQLQPVRRRRSNAA